jgi:hypothetical protein
VLIELQGCHLTANHLLMVQCRLVPVCTLAPCVLQDAAAQAEAAADARLRRAMTPEEAQDAARASVNAAEARRQADSAAVGTRSQQQVVTGSYCGGDTLCGVDAYGAYLSPMSTTACGCATQCDAGHFHQDQGCQYTCVNRWLPAVQEDAAAAENAVQDTTRQVAGAVSQGIEAVPTPAETVQGAADQAAEGIRGAGQVHTEAGSPSVCYHDSILAAFWFCCLLLWRHSVKLSSSNGKDPKQVILKCNSAFFDGMRWTPCRQLGRRRPSRRMCRRGRSRWQLMSSVARARPRASCRAA